MQLAGHDHDLGWLGIFRLGLVQAALGAMAVLALLCATAFVLALLALLALRGVKGRAHAAYACVFAPEALLFLWAARLATCIDNPAAPAPLQQQTPGAPLAHAGTLVNVR